MLKRIRNEPLATLCILLWLVFFIVAAKPAGVSGLTSLWIGDQTVTADVTPGVNDLMVTGTGEFDGNVRLDGGYSTAAATLNTSSTAITLTAADSGQLFYENTSSLTASGVPIVYTLPADPTGLTFTFALGTSLNQVAVNPAAGDTIATGDTDYYYWADSGGDTLVIMGINSSTWVVISATAVDSGSWQFADDS